MSEKFPSPEAEPNPEFKKRIVELFEMGLNSEDIYAYHGTTVEAIEYLTQHGRLPSSGSYQSELFYAQLDDQHSENKQLDHAEHYAGWNAWKFYLLEQLPFRPQNLEHFMYILVDDDYYDAFVEEAKSHGVTKRTIDRLTREAERKRKGVVLTLSHRLKQDFEEKADTDHDQRSVVTSGGLSLDYITGIEPLGQYEWNKLEGLQRELE